jgi:hypothetical protein
MPLRLAARAAPGKPSGARKQRFERREATQRGGSQVARVDEGDDALVTAAG